MRSILYAGTVGILVFMFFSSCSSLTVVRYSEDTEVNLMEGQLPVRIPSYALEVSRNNRKTRVVVQDILDDSRYPEASKGYTRNQLIRVDLNNDGKASETLKVLFNIDIYAYDISNSGSVKDPGPNIDQRIAYNRKISGDNPVVIEFRLSDFIQATDDIVGVEIINSADELGLYYFEPGKRGGEGTWRPIEYLEHKGEIAIEVNGDQVILTIFKWPKDDRLHGRG